MVLEDLAQHTRYETLHPLFAQAFRFINTTDLQKLPDGKAEIDGDALFAIISRPGTSQTASKLEAHQKYIDIHIAVQGNDTIGWKARQECRLPVGDFNDKDDYILYDDNDFIKMTLQPNKFMILFPEDAHAPLLETKDLFKIVLKIKL